MTKTTPAGSDQDAARMAYERLCERLDAFYRNLPRHPADAEGGHRHVTLSLDVLVDLASRAGL